MLLAGAAGGLVTSASAQTVQLAGQMGQRAVLVVNGEARTLAPGQSHAGVKLLSVGAGEAQVEQGGRVLTLRLGAVPATAGAPGAGSSGGGVVVMTAGLGGHFIGEGAINGRAVRFMVDTGASTIAMSRAEAERLGLDWRSGPRGVSSTANGNVEVNAVMLSRVRLGEVEVSNVQALVVPAPMPYVLLGNSFLSRFQMERRNDVMRLELRP
jgi:aspartyl protease family protein